MSRIPDGLIVLLALAASPLAFGATFVAPDAIDWKAALPVPPAADSLTTRAELEVVLQLQIDRTTEQAAFATNPPNADVFAFGAPVLGAWFRAENLPQTAGLFADIDADGTPIANAAKAVFPARARPFLADARINAPLSRPAGSTYPGGHGFTGTYRAALLAEIFPERSEALHARARTIAWSRVIAGVHYPTDNTAARDLAEVFVRKLKENAAFRDALAVTRAELQAVRLRNTP